MGIISSVLCTITFCMERMFTCISCSCLFMLMLTAILLMLIYGIAIGYNYSQREISNFAVSNRPPGLGPGVTKPSLARRSGGEDEEEDDESDHRRRSIEGDLEDIAASGEAAPYVKMVARNETAEENRRRRLELLARTTAVDYVFRGVPTGALPIIRATHRGEAAKAEVFDETQDVEKYSIKNMLSQMIKNEEVRKAAGGADAA